MKNLRSRINIFFSDYDLTTADTRKMSRADMNDNDALMTAYESVWLTMEHYDRSEPEYAWLSALYADLGDYITYGDDGKSVAMGKRVALVFGVLCLFIFAMCATVSLDAMTIIGLVLSVVVIVLAGIGVYADAKSGV